jgi:D-alanyl-D-alanine carboxypeptidase
MNEGTLRVQRQTTGQSLKPSALRRVFFVSAALFVLLAIAPAPVQAKYASFVMDADTGTVYHSINADTRNYPASLTKMMTLYLVFEALDKRHWTLATKLKVSARAARQPASKLALAAGKSISVKNAILALVTKSANDVATVIAEAMSKSERGFALKMTATARRIGMARTTFRNASGLPHRSQMSTARDMATLARALINHYPQYYHFFSTPKFSYAGLTHRNHNKLLVSYKGTDGIKTGYIRASGFNLVASVERDGRRLIGVVFGGKSSGSRNRHMTALLNKGYKAIAKAAETRTAKAQPPVTIQPSPSKPKTAQNKTTVAQTAPPPAEKAVPSRPLGDYAVQVGAYRRKNPAYERAREAVETAPGYLREGVIKIVPLYKKKRKPLYRARIAGLEKKQAYRACHKLEGKGMDCLVVVMKGLQVASNP